MGTIPKSSSHGNIRPSEFCTNQTKSSQYCGHVNTIFSQVTNHSNFSLESPVQIINNFLASILLNALIAISSLLNSVSADIMI